MHELSVTQSILDIALKHARQQDGGAVRRIVVVVGALASIVDDSVAFYWPTLAAGTQAERADLVFERIPAKFRCNSCRVEYLLHPGDFSCPACRSQNVQVIDGQQFYVKTIDLEVTTEESL